MLDLPWIAVDEINEAPPDGEPRALARARELAFRAELQLADLQIDLHKLRLRSFDSLAPLLQARQKEASLAFEQVQATVSDILANAFAGESCRKSQA